MKKLQDYRELDSVFDQKNGLVLTVGNFDGVHLGHQSILGQLRAHADQNSLQIAVMTFDPHPIEFFRPGEAFERIFSLEDQESQLAKFGVDVLIRQKFDEQFAQMSAEQFLQEILLARRVRAIAVGHDFRFGSGRSGDRTMLESFCQQQGIYFYDVEAVRSRDGEVISSTRVRQLLKSHQVSLAAEYLGRHFFLEGIVVPGRQLAQQLGVPTANLQLQTPFVPGVGVYLTRTEVDGKSYDSITNIGYAPTIEIEKKIKIETHLFHFQKEIYGAQLRISFLEFCRPEKKFENMEALKTQLGEDLILAKEFFRENS